ncbi:hypothetical protein DL96DRAFT_1472920 [Flagelloscypha sp. PMI_526]|nr:hypothetical protein DL96DRAFT_1472920 [Flagelloscypha sp. PMI_526]
MSNVSSPLNRLLATEPPQPFIAKSSQGRRIRFLRRTKVLLLTAGVIVVSILILVRSLYSLNYEQHTAAAPHSNLEFEQSESSLSLCPEHDPSSTITKTVISIHYTATATETVTVYKEAPLSLKYEQLEPVVFSLIAWSKSSGAELSLLIKSILMYITGPVELHILCDEDAKEAIKPGLSLIHSPTYEVKVRYYMPTWDDMVSRIEREGSIASAHAAGTPGLMKLFLQEIIPVKKAIYVDTDALFISDPRHLWHEFKSFKNTTAVSMTSHSDRGTPEWQNADRICSCVMLLDFEKLREMCLMDSTLYHQVGSGLKATSPPAFKAKFGAPDPSDGIYHNVRLGDQGYWWAIVDYFPELWEPLSFDYEVSSCLMEMYETRLGEVEIDEQQEIYEQGHVGNTPQFGKVVRPKLLHFNCLDEAERWYEWRGWSDSNNKLGRRWGAAVLYHVGFKWIWLNRFSFDDSQPKIDIEIAEVVFEDQKFASQDSIL